MRIWCELLDLSIALVEPLYEVNVGHVSRVIANFGFSNLILVDPKVNLKKARKFASHGAYVLDNATICKFNDLMKFDYLIGTTAISNSNWPNIRRSSVSPLFMAESLAKFSGSVCLIFGRDTIGLNCQELDSVDMIVSISTNPLYPTLNIGQAAAIIIYELSKHKLRDQKKIATKEQRSLMMYHYLELIDSLGLPNYKKPIFESAFRKLTNRSLPTQREVTLLIGLFRKSNMALKRHQSSPKHKHISKSSDLS